MMMSGQKSVDDCNAGVLVYQEDEEVPDNLDRERRSGITRNSLGGDHLLRRGKRNRAGPYIRGGKGTNFGGGHMMRTGK